MPKTVSRSKYHKGWLPIGDSRWRVETVDNGKFVVLGEVFVKGTVVSREMDSHGGVKGYEPKDIAERLAVKKWPYKSLILTETELILRCSKRGEKK